VSVSWLKASSKIRAAATALALVCTVAFAQAQGPKYRLSVDAPTKELRELLSKGLQLARWIEDPQMTPELLRRLADEAVGQAREALAAQGYYSALVSFSIDRDSTPWAVTIHVVPGTRTTVRAVEIGFSGPGAQDPEAADLRRRVQREWLLRPGMPFTQDAWDEAKRDAVRKLSAWRYAGARLASSRARVDPETNSATLELTLDSGPAYVFGGLQVRGPKRYPDEVVSNLSPVKPGATYDRQVLELYTRRLLETGYFASARAELAPDAADDRGAPVRASVIEGNSQNIEGGISFNTDAGLRFEVTHRNVDLFETAWRGKSQLRLDQLTQEARYDLDSPPRRGATWWSGFTGAKRSIVQNEDNEEVAIGAAHNWAGRGVPTQVLVSAHAEEQRLSGQPNDHRHAVFFGFRFGFRDTDDIVLPRRGYFGQVTLGGAPDALSTRGFHRATARATVLVPLTRNDDLQLRGEGGVVVARSREGIPSTFLFRTGGDQTVRGYDFESLGVRQGDAVLGGRYLAVGSVEYTHWFGQAWGLATFLDGGNAWDTGDFDPVFGVGFGARFRTPIGPIRLDLAYGEEESSWRLHFSVGFVF
jgi:translocation and assembly module TamA